VVASSQSQGGYSVYVDPATIRRQGDLVKVWSLFDYKTIQTVAGFLYLSSKVQREFDCAEEHMRALAGSEFSGNLGSGNVLYHDSDAGTWEPVAPDSVGQILWTFACRKQ